MTKQELAQKRNWFKFQLLGMIKPIDYKALTSRERVIHERIIKYRNILIKEFDTSSREKGLNIKRKNKFKK